MCIIIFCWVWHSFIELRLNSLACSSDIDDESPSLSSTTTTSTTSSILRCTNHTRANLPLPHVADVIAQHRKRVLGSKCHITLSGLAPSHIPADRCLAGRIVRSLGAVLHFGLRLPPPVRSLGPEISFSGSSEQTTVADDNNPNLLWVFVWCFWILSTELALCK